MRFRKLGLALVIAVVAAFAVMAAPAFADDEGTAVQTDTIPSPGYNPDPQTTNIPYLGWLGNTIKVAKCLNFRGGITEPEISAAQSSLGVSVSFPGTFQVEDWSGVNEVNAGPRWLNGQIGFNSSTVPVEITNRGICWTAQVTSNKPGLAVIKLAVSAEVLASLHLQFGGMLDDEQGGVSLDNIALYREILLKHQFLAIWLKSQAPVINEVGPAQPGGNLSGYPIASGAPVGDGALADGNGDGVFTPPFDLSLYGGDISNVFGVVKATVKGTFPMGNDFTGMFPGDVVTLPDQWADLANKLAVDDTSALGGAPGSAAMRWDIHDDNTGHPLGVNPAPFHSINASCNTGTLVGFDAVDNCWGGDSNEAGPFSRVNGATYPTVGPFDALFPNQTLLNDGNLNAFDAPMPPIRMDFALSANSIGAFAKANKDDVYDADNTNDNTHELYAPFYKAYIPAAGALGRSGGSGVAGSFVSNNYPGFLDNGRYDYWSIYPQAERGGYNNCKDPNGKPYPLPTGPSQVSVYTDEHGEAFVKFLPYVGNYLTNDTQYRCNVKPGLYGEADIQATAHYPDQQPLWDGSKLSNTIHKVANQLANKTLVCIKKPATESEAFCVETVVDWNGDPMSGVEVRFSTSGNNGQLDAASTDLIPGFDTIGQGQGAKDPAGRWIELWTNKKGQVGIDVLSSDACVDVTSQNLETKWDNWDESGIFGSPVSLTYKVDPATGLACGTATENPTAIVGLGTTPAGSGSTGGTNTGGTNTGGTSTGGTVSTGGSPAPAATSTASTVVSLGGPIIQAQPVLSATTSVVVAKASARLFSVKVLQSKLGRFIVVNVKGSTTLKKSQVLFLVKNKKTGKLVKVWKSLPSTTVRIQVLGKNGKVIRTITRTVPVNRSFMITNFKLPKTAASVRTTVVA